MRRLRLTPIAIVLGVLIGAAMLVNAVAFSDSPTDVAFSHQGLPEPPNCQKLAVDEEGMATSADRSGAGVEATPLHPEEDATPTAPTTPGTPGPLADLDLRIEAAAANDSTVELGLSHPLRLFTLRLGATDATREIRVECEVGFFVLYVVSGEVDVTHHAAPVKPNSGETGTTLGEAGAVSYVPSGGPSEVRIEVGATVTLRAGDAIFVEQAVFT